MKRLPEQRQADMEDAAVIETERQYGRMSDAAAVLWAKGRKGWNR